MIHAADDTLEIIARDVPAAAASVIVAVAAIWLAAHVVTRLTRDDNDDKCEDPPE